MLHAMLAGKGSRQNQDRQRRWFSFHNIETDIWEEVPKGIVHPRSLFNSRWQLAVLCSLFYICLYIPFETAFDPVYDNQLTTDLVAFLSAVIDIIFLADIGVSFCLAFTVDDVLITDRREISIAYSKSWLVIDATASIAAVLEMLNGNGVAMAKNVRVLKFFRILKMLRAFKLASLVGEDMMVEADTSLKMLKLLCISVTFSHFCACMFYGGIDNSTESVFDETSWARSYLGDGYRTLGIERHYATAMYWVG